MTSAVFFSFRKQKNILWFSLSLDALNILVVANYCAPEKATFFVVFLWKRFASFDHNKIRTLQFWFLQVYFFFLKNLRRCLIQKNLFSCTNYTFLMLASGLMISRKGALRALTSRVLKKCFNLPNFFTIFSLQ